MSHRGTNWAIQQRGLKPATKLVLWHLTDRHNPDFGCFPSQEQLAHDAEMSRSTLNEHLDLLEAAGLLRRERRHDPLTHRRLRTRYILGFEEDFGMEPCPESGHGIGETDREHPAEPCPEIGHGAMSGPSDMDPKNHVRIFTEAMSGKPQKPCPEAAGQQEPVREPVREPVKEEEGAQARARPVSGSGPVLSPRDPDVPGSAAVDPAAAVADVLRRVLVAVGHAPDVWVPGWWRGRSAEEHVSRWIAMLGPERVVEVAVASRVDNPEPPDGPKALDRAMARAARALPESGPGRRRWGSTDPSPVPATGKVDPVEFWSGQIAQGAYVPPSAISPSQAREMLARGLVKLDKLRSRGIAV